jgi:hypothetical protein
MKKPFVCWRCGAAIKPDQRPITRLERCRACQADLYVCRQCRHYTTRLTGYCDHDHAEPPRERERANFCQYFTPRPDAHTRKEDVDARHARTGLDALFGSPDGHSAEPDPGSEADHAREELDRLFDADPTDEASKTSRD